MPRIMRSEIIDLDALCSNSREQLIDRLAGVVLRAFDHPDPEQVKEHVVMRGPKTTLMVLYGENDEIAGFASWEFTKSSHAGEPYAVMDGGLAIAE